MPAIIFSLLAIAAFVVGPLAYFASGKALRVREARLWRACVIQAMQVVLGIGGLALSVRFSGGSSIGVAVLSFLIGTIVSVYVIRRVFRTTLLRAASCYLLAAGINVGVVLGLRALAVEAFMIPTGSMAPTLIPGDRVVTDKLTLRFRSPHKGEVVVFIPPPQPQQKHIKRVVATEGDQLDLRENVLYVNGQPLGPCEIRKGSMPPGEFKGPEYPVVVPPGKLFILGDNRESSLDSRHFGFVDVGSVIALAGVIYASGELPSDDFRPLPTPSPSAGSRWGRIGTIVK